MQAVLAGQDVLALLPTGGGKSVCFQVPALALGGICLVVCPLITLMKDQIGRLKAMGIKAEAIHAGLTHIEIGTILNDCVNGDEPPAFLYMSPERLENDVVKDRILNMHVRLIAIDEAHCISEWGHDFRPAYRRIAQLRDLLPKVPIIALTATATPQVANDIKAQLKFKATALQFTASFSRPNLSLSVFNVEDKEAKIKSILAGVDGSAIIYVRSRLGAQNITEYLKKYGISADFLHAGLVVAARNQRQERWLVGKVRVMVATIAFGMGIDKPDVRLVIHADLPESLESYFQEVGRAGRDGKKAFGVLLHYPAEAKVLAQKIEANHPEVETVRRVYNALGQYLSIPMGEGYMSSHPFDLEKFINRFAFTNRACLSALHILERGEFIALSDAFKHPSRILFSSQPTEMYEFQVQNPALEPLIKIILRLYGGQVFSDFITIREDSIGHYLHTDGRNIVAQLRYLARMGIIQYLEPSDKPILTFLTARQEAEHLPLRALNLEAKKANDLHKAQSVASYLAERDTCRMQTLVGYFQEGQSIVCGLCDICLAKRKNEPKVTPDAIMEKIIGEGISSKDLVASFPASQKITVVATIKSLLSAGHIATIAGGKLIKK